MNISPPVGGDTHLEMAVKIINQIVQQKVGLGACRLPLNNAVPLSFTFVSRCRCSPAQRIMSVLCCSGPQVSAATSLSVIVGLYISAEVLCNC